MPRLEVDGEGSWPLVATLVHVPGGVVEDPEHGDQDIAAAISTGNVGTSGSDAMHVKTNTSSRLGDEGALLEGVVDALDTVAVHGEEEAAAELGPGGGSVEQGGEVWVNSFRDKRMFSIALSIPSPWMTTDTLINIC